MTEWPMIAYDRWLVLFPSSVAKAKDRYIITLPKSLGKQLVGEEVEVIINYRYMFRGKVLSCGDRYVIPLPKDLGEKLHKEIVQVVIATEKPVKYDLKTRGRGCAIVPPAGKLDLILGSPEFAK